MQFTYRELLRPRLIGLTLITMCVMVGVFTVTGPIGTYDTLSPTKRLAYWSLAVSLGWFICYAKSVLTLYFMRLRSRIENALVMTVATLIAAMPVTAVLYTVEGLLRPDHPPFAGLLTMYAIVATVITLLTTLYVHFVCQLVKHAGAPAEAAANGVVAHGGAADAPPIPDAVDTEPVPARGSGNACAHRVAANEAASRLSGISGGDIIHLKIDDHYVEVFTATDSHIVRMSFADAIAELGDLGIQVHRSYWVARRHVIGTERRKDRTLLRLTGGHRVPVSRTYLPAVRASLPAMCAAVPR